jgi:hypothetical protein
VASSQPCFEQQIGSITGFVGTYTDPISIGLVTGLHRMALADQGYLKPSSFPAGIGPFGYPLGQSLRAQYDALAPPIPAHIAALVELFETKK